MASMKMKEQLEEQKEEKPIIRNCQEKLENVDTNESNLAKSSEGMDQESTNLPTSRHHRKLPAELNCQIFYCLNLATRHKFICQLGWNFYGMFRQILLKKSIRLRNAEGNGWRRSNRHVKITEDGLVARHNTYGWQNVYAEKGFPMSVAGCRMDNFPGTISYYYEVKISKSASWCDVGLTDGEIPFYRWIGESPNSYAISIPIPTRNFYLFRLSGQRHSFQFAGGVIRPEKKETGNVVGCGILMNPDDKMTLFFTFNGILIGHQFPIDPTVDHLFPTTELWNKMSSEANFGDNPAKPFEYDIKKCPGLGLDCI